MVFEKFLSVKFILKIKLNWLKKISLRSPGSRFFSSPAFPETKVLFFWPNHLRCNNSGKGDNGLYIGSDSNYSASENIINQNNTNEPAQNPASVLITALTLLHPLGIADPILKPHRP